MQKLKRKHKGRHKLSWENLPTQARKLKNPAPQKVSLFYAQNKYSDLMLMFDDSQASTNKLLLKELNLPNHTCLTDSLHNEYDITVIDHILIKYP